MKIKEIFVSSPELKKLKDSLDDVAKIQYPASLSKDLLQDMYRKLRTFCGKIVEEKSKSTNATDKGKWARKNEEKNVYAYVYANNPMPGEQNLSNSDAVGGDCHKLYKMSDTFTRFPWSKLRDAGVAVITDASCVELLHRCSRSLSEIHLATKAKLTTSWLSKEIPNIRKKIKSFMRRYNKFEDMQSPLNNYIDTLVEQLCKKLK